MQGVCIDPWQSLMIQKDQKYYLFEHGPNNYLVSKFNKKSSHFGSFQRKYFKLIQENKEEWPDEPDCSNGFYELDPDKTYKARLIWRKPGYKMTELGFYYIKPKKTHCYFWHDPQMEHAGGCYPLHWFCDFIEYTHAEICEEQVIKEQYHQELPPDDWQQLNLFDF